MDAITNYTSYLIAIGGILFFILESLEKLEKAISVISSKNIPIDNVSISDKGGGTKSLVIPFTSLCYFFRLWRNQRYLEQGKYFSKIIIALLLVLFGLQLLSDLFSTIVTFYSQISTFIKFITHSIALMFLIIWSFLYRLSKKYIVNTVA